MTGARDPVSPEFDFGAVSGRRMHRQFLDRPGHHTPADVATRMCAVHAQVMSAAELSIGLRIADATRATTQDALWRDRSLVKTFGPRGTLHLLPSETLSMWVGAMSALPPVPSSHRKDVRFSDEESAIVVEAIGTALAGAELIADDLHEAVVELAGTWAGELTMPAFQGMWPRWRQSLPDAARAGVLCFAPNRGRNVVYTNPRRWLPGLRPEPAGTALRHLTEAYLRAYGPASPRHLARWLAIAPTRAAGLLDGLGTGARQVRLGGEPAYVLTGDDVPPTERPPGVRLLPYFDNFVVAGAPRGLLFPGDVSTRALTPSGQAGNYPVLLVDGRVRGVWHQRRKGSRLDVTVEPLGELTRAQLAELDEQVDLVGAILGARPSLTLGAVGVGGHA